MVYDTQSLDFATLLNMALLNLCRFVTMGVLGVQYSYSYAD